MKSSICIDPYMLCMNIYIWTWVWNLGWENNSNIMRNYSVGNLGWEYNSKMIPFENLAAEIQHMHESLHAMHESLHAMPVRHWPISKLKLTPSRFKTYKMPMQSHFKPYEILMPSHFKTLTCCCS